LALTGHEGFLLRTANNGAAFQEVLNVPVRFFIDWDGGNPERVYAGGSPNGGTGQVFVSRNLGNTWASITGELAPLYIFRVEADLDRLGVAYAATDDGVYRFYGGGFPICLDSRSGVDHVQVWPTACPPVLGPGPVIPGDAIALEVEALTQTSSHVDLGEVECLVDDADIALATLDPPDPAPGDTVGFLVRLVGSSDYGSSSGSLPRLASWGDCP
jgi:hypothetical protein